MPGLVSEMRIGRHSVDLDAQLLEFGVAVGEIAQFGRADEGEVGRVEEDDRPLALQVFIRDLNELAGVEGGSGKREGLRY